MENKIKVYLKRFVSVVMIVILLLSVAPVTLPENSLVFDADAAATALKEGYYTYKLNEGKAIITDVDESISGNITIPSKLGGYSVVEIGSDAFRYCKNLTGVVIPSTVEKIAEFAFCYCTSITEITIPNSVKTIGVQAFYCCEAIKGISIPESVTDIGTGVFSGCYSLSNISVDRNNPKYLSESGILFNKNKTTLICFPANLQLQSYSIPSSVTKIDDYAFCYAKNLKTVSLSNSLSIIGRYAFTSCTSLEKISIPDSVGIVGESAFRFCSSLREVKCSDRMERIEAQTFDDCSNLETIKLPSNLKYIGNSAFDCCSKISGFVIPDTVTYVGSGAFFGTKDYNNKSNWDNGVFYLGEYLLDVNYEFNAADYTIKSGTKLIADSAFYAEDTLKTVTIPASVKIICAYAFSSCDNLSKINITDSVESIYANAFSYTAFYRDTSNWNNQVIYLGKHLIENRNTSSAAFSVKDGTITIAEGAFDYSYAKTITIPASVTNIMEDAFSGNFKLNAINVSSANKHYYSSSGVLFGKDGTLLAFPISKDVTSYTVPSGTKAIGKRAFYMAELDVLHIPEGVTKIHEEAFYYAEIITISIPKSVKYIGKDILRYYTTNIGYLGNATEWRKIAIHPDNENLNYANVIYNYVPHTHQYTSRITKAPNCKESGLRTYTCSCGSTYSVYVYDYSAHQLDSGKVTKKATYKSTGTKIYVCKICGITVKTETLPKLTLGKVTGLKAKKVKVAKSSEITLAWDKIGDGVKYEVYVKNGSKWTKLTTTSKTSYTVKKDGKKKSLKADKEYQFRVRAVVDDIKGKYSSTLKVETIPLTATLKLKAGKKQLTASWSKVSDISGYEVQYSTSKKFTKKTTKTVNVKKSSKKTTVKKLKKGKKYFVRIRTYKTVNGKKIYSGWSTVKNVKVK